MKFRDMMEWSVGIFLVIFIVIPFLISTFTGETMFDVVLIAFLVFSGFIFNLTGVPGVGALLLFFIGAVTMAIFFYYNKNSPNKVSKPLIKYSLISIFVLCFGTLLVIFAFWVLILAMWS